MSSAILVLEGYGHSQAELVEALLQMSAGTSMSRLDAHDLAARVRGAVGRLLTVTQALRVRSISDIGPEGLLWVAPPHGGSRVVVTVAITSQGLTIQRQAAPRQAENGVITMILREVSP